jgi:predicted sugar kinase
MFAPWQHDLYAHPRVAALVQVLRAAGVRGVGQSSWGPAVCAVLENDAAAVDFLERIRSQLDPDATLLLTEPNSHGARITSGAAP